MTLNFLLTSDWSEKCMSFEERTGTSKLFFLPLAHYMVFRLADTLHLENSSLWPLKRKKSEVSRRGGESSVVRTEAYIGSDDLQCFF